MDQTLFEKYGGFSVISKIVLDLYDRLMDDEVVGPFFDDIDFAKQVDHQTKFVSSLMGGPASYTDDQIEKLHNHLTIAEHHFDQLTKILGQVLRDHGVSNEDAETVIGEFSNRQALVVKS